jgi:hypothetical protein
MSVVGYTHQTSRESESLGTCGPLWGYPQRSKLFRLHPANRLASCDVDVLTCVNVHLIIHLKCALVPDQPLGSLQASFCVRRKTILEQLEICPELLVECAE